MMTMLSSLLALILASEISHPITALAFSLPSLAKQPPKPTFCYTHLEGNGQIWQATSNNGGTRIKASIVIDPLASQLDFGIPNLYRANKNALTEQATIKLICDAQPSHCLLTMGLDDHTHLPTIQKLSEAMPELKYIVAPSCEKKLRSSGLLPIMDKITVLDHGESCDLGEGVTVTATQGALVGPPWQKREIGLLLQLLNGNSSREEQGKEQEPFSIYYEPHADVVLRNLKKYRANIMVSPVTQQSLPAQVPPIGRFTLVYGGGRTLEIAESLGAQVIVPLGNGALDVAGPLSPLVAAVGDVSDFEKLVEKRNVGRNDEIRVAKASPGRPLTVQI